MKTPQVSMTRRHFVASTAIGAAAANAGLLGPFVRAIAADDDAAASGRVLIVLQLDGGNDGLNTVVPWGDDTYYKLRPTLGIAPNDVLRLDEHTGLHPELVELRDLYDQGSLAIVQNVGYPRQNRSHFTSTDIWNKGVWFDPTVPADVLDGWLGRYFDAYCASDDSPMLGLQIGSRSTLAFAHARPRGVTIENPQIMSWQPWEQDLQALHSHIDERAAPRSDFEYVQRVSRQTLSLADRIQGARSAPSRAEYAPFHLSQSLRMIGQMIAAELPTRVFFVTISGFDTHDEQQRRHRGPLQELSQALGAFAQDMRAAGHWERVAVMTYSEFGRLAAENGTGGTDHGSASLMLLAGGSLEGGLFGGVPDLTGLDDGGVPYRIDFRSVYAGVLQDWFGVDPTPVLLDDFEPIEVLKPA